MGSTETAIRSWLDQWLRASASGDYQSMLSMLADDVVFLVPGAPPFGKQEFASAWEGPMKGAKIHSEAKLEECIESADLAGTRTRLTVTITTATGATSRASGYTLSLFRRQPDGRWLLARDANLLTPAQE